MTKEQFINEVYKDASLYFGGIDINEQDVESLKKNAKINIITNDKHMFAAIKNPDNNDEIAVFNLFNDNIIETKFVKYNDFINSNSKILTAIAKYYDDILNKKYDDLEKYENDIPNEYKLINVSEIIKTPLPV